jgi:hypothetical protein
VEASRAAFTDSLVVMAVISAVLSVALATLVILKFKK